MGVEYVFDLKNFYLMTFNTLEEFELWQDARELARKVFILSNRELFANDFRFKNQIRAASGSIMDNIAEGLGRGGSKEFIHFLSIANGSLLEVRSQIYRAHDYQDISDEDLNEILEKTEILAKKIGYVLNGGECLSLQHEKDTRNSVTV